MSNQRQLVQRRPQSVPQWYVGTRQIRISFLSCYIFQPYTADVQERQTWAGSMERNTGLYFGLRFAQKLCKKWRQIIIKMASCLSWPHHWWWWQLLYKLFRMQPTSPCLPQKWPQSNPLYVEFPTVFCAAGCMCIDVVLAYAVFLIFSHKKIKILHSESALQPTSYTLMQWNVNTAGVHVRWSKNVIVSIVQHKASRY